MGNMLRGSGLFLFVTGRGICGTRGILPFFGRSARFPHTLFASRLLPEVCSNRGLCSALVPPPCASCIPTMRPVHVSSPPCGTRLALSSAVPTARAPAMCLSSHNMLQDCHATRAPPNAHQHLASYYYSLNSTKPSVAPPGLRKTCITPRYTCGSCPALGGTGLASLQTACQNTRLGICVERMSTLRLGP